jgi:hypothetical protein
VYQISLDSSPTGTFNASTTVTTYNTLLFFATALEGTKGHEVVITNQVDGGFFALDYIVAVQPGPGGAVATTASTTAATGSTPGATAVFPNGSPNTGGTVAHANNNNSSSAGAVIGGILGGLAALVSCKYVSNDIGADGGLVRHYYIYIGGTTCTGKQAARGTSSLRCVDLDEGRLYSRRRRKRSSRSGLC